MKKEGRKIHLDARAASLILLIAGVLMIVNPGLFAGITCFIIGLGILVFGVMKIVGCALRPAGENSPADTIQLMFGIICAAAGLVLIFRYRSVLSIINFFVGIFILADSIMKIRTAFIARKSGYRYWKVMIGISVVSAVLSVILIIDPFKGTEFFYTFIGIALVSDGLVGLFGGEYM